MELVSSDSLSRDYSGSYFDQFSLLLLYRFPCSSYPRLSPSLALPIQYLGTPKGNFLVRCLICMHRSYILHLFTIPRVVPSHRVLHLSWSRRPPSSGHQSHHQVPTDPMSSSSTWSSPEAAASPPWIRFIKAKYSLSLLCLYFFSTSDFCCNAPEFEALDLGGAARWHTPCTLAESTKMDGAVFIYFIISRALAPEFVKCLFFIFHIKDWTLNILLNGGNLSLLCDARAICWGKMKLNICNNCSKM